MRRNMNLREAIQKNKDLWITAVARYIAQFAESFKPENFLDKKELEEYKRTNLLIENARECGDN